MASLSSRASDAHLSDAERRENERKKQALREFYERNGRVYVGKLAFLRCWGTIKPWINIQSLMGHLMKNGLVNSSDDMEAISSGMLPAATRDKNLHDLLQANGGGNGYFFFYMSLCESLESNPLGHGDAVDELEKTARDCGEQPPWIRNTSVPFSSLSRADSSSEMGPQTMSSLSTTSTFSSINSSIQPSTLRSNSTTSTGQSSTVPPRSSELSGQATPPAGPQSSQQVNQPLTHGSSSTSGQPSSRGSPSQPSGQGSSTNPNRPSSQTSPSSSHQPGGHLLPQHRPKDPGAPKSQAACGTSGARGAGGGRKDVNNWDMKSGATVVQGGAMTNIVAKSGGANMFPFKKEGYTSNESYSHGTQSPCFADPQKETCRWPNMSFSSLESDVERDQPGPPNVSGDGQGPQTADTASIIELLVMIERHVSDGEVDVLCNKHDDKIDFGCSMEGNKSDFMDDVCRFVCGALNTRDSGKVGVFVGGVREPENEDEAYLVEGVKFNENRKRSIEQNYKRKLKEVIHVHGRVREELTPEELHLVQLKFVESLNESQLALVTVTPNLAVCKGRTYVCQFRDGGGRAKSECYVRRDGETVHLRQPKKITDLSNKLNQ